MTKKTFQCVILYIHKDTGVTSKNIRKVVQMGLDLLPELPEWLSKDIINKYNFNSFSSTLIKIHNPLNKKDINGKIKQRLAYDELLANQIIIAINRNTKKNNKTNSISGDGKLRNTIVASLPFKMTTAQESENNKSRHQRYHANDTTFTR